MGTDMFDVQRTTDHWLEGKASLMLRKLGSYPRQNGLALALRELGRIERTLFILDWLQSVELRRVNAGLNKGSHRRLPMAEHCQGRSREFRPLRP
jgi:TnpA family transposase